MKKIDVFSLLEKPIWQLSGEEFIALSAFAVRMADDDDSSTVKNVTRITGVRALAQYIECSESMVYHLRREGVLDTAILSHVGKKIVFDGDRARELAEAYQSRQRAERNNKD